MTEVEKELERFISSGEATTSIDNSGFQTTHIDPLKIAKHFAQWQREQMMKDAIDATVTSIREYREENEVDFTIMLEKGIVPYVSEEDVKLIIIKGE